MLPTMTRLTGEFHLVWLQDEDGETAVGTATKVCSRGLRLKVGIDMGRVVDSVHPATGRMAYRGRAMSRAARIASAASCGQVGPCRACLLAVDLASTCFVCGGGHRSSLATGEAAASHTTLAARHYCTIGWDCSVTRHFCQLLVAVRVLVCSGRLAFAKWHTASIRA
jgi:hypothetical protein